MNQMTTKITKGDSDNGETRLVPALGISLYSRIGESWGHSCTIRIVLNWNNGSRKAILIKCPGKPENTIEFSITVFFID